MKEPKRYFMGWIVGKQFNKQSALTYAEELNYGENLTAVKKHEGYFAIYSENLRRSQ